MPKKSIEIIETIKGGELDQNINKFLTYVEQQYTSETTIKKYYSYIHKFKKYCYKNNITDPFSDTVFSEYFTYIYNFHSKQYYQYTIHALNAFKNFSLSQPLKKTYTDNEYIFKSSEFTNILSQFYTFLVQSEIKETTKMLHYNGIRRFLIYLEKQQILSFKQLAIGQIFDYINSSNLAHATKCSYSRTLKKFFDFTFNQNITAYSGNQIFSKIKRNYNQRILSFYSTKEISALLTIIDTSTILGKRNYAIILLAALLGFRASDIVNLKFSNIDWNNKLITIVQQKTGTKLIQPFPSEIFFALLDYWKNARPSTDITNFFITFTCPYRALCPASLSVMATKYFKLANIDISHRKHGMHSLRHSLANNMLHNNISFQDISASLGHSYMSTTTMYINSDINTMKLLSLEV